MNKYKAPAFQYYPRDVLMDPRVAAMTLAEFGAYWTLMSYVWLEGSLLFDEKLLARLLRVTPEEFHALWPSMKKLFRVKEGKITSPQLNEQRAKQAAWRLKSAEGGRKSGEMRRKGGSKMVEESLKGGSRVVEPKRKTAFASASASSTAIADPPPTPSTNDVATDVGVGGSKNSSEQKNISQQQSKHVDGLSSKAQAARQRTPESNGMGDGAGTESKFNVTIRREYRDAHDLGNGWLVTSDSGRYDPHIEEWMNNGKPPNVRKGRSANTFDEDEILAGFADLAEMKDDEDILSRIGQDN